MLTSGLTSGLALLLGSAHGILELSIGIFLLHLAVQCHHAHVPFAQGGAQLALATLLLTLLTSLLTIGHFASIYPKENYQQSLRGG